MKKTLITGLLAAAIITLTLSGCKNPAAETAEDKGTVPTLYEFFITNNNADFSGGSIDINNETKYPRLHEVTLESNTDNPTHLYKLVLYYTDPDMDATKMEISVYPDFRNNWLSGSFTQSYNPQITWYYDQYVPGTNPGTITVYVRITDKKGNVSNVVTYSANAVTE